MPASDVPVRAPEPAEGAPDGTPPATATPVGGAAPKRARRAPAEKAEKKTAPTARKAPATSRRTAVAPEFTAPDRADQSPSGTPDTAVDAAGAAPRPVRARRSTKTAPAAKTSPTKRATTPAPTEPGPDAAAGDQPKTRPAVRKRTGATAERPAELIVGPNVPGPDAGRPERTEHEPAEHQPDTRTPVAGWQAVGPRLRDHPGFAPELLALAAVDALGPRARSWVEQVRSAYPAADADGVARLATRRFVRMAGTGGALAAGAGVFAPVAELAAVLWTQANLVLHVAAAYGRDPAHPDRAAELLVLTSVHPDDGAARAALAAARAADVPADGPWGRTAEAAWRLATPVAAQAGGWLGLRLAARLLPGAAVLAATIGGTAAAERVAARAVARYRRAGQSQSNQDLGSSA
ncbi:hypothetical protein [Micromonospora sp. NPDC049240]|uniref:hypothetical protein n=1 Tax=Micromonospora sp. NPDC049240 TaxID=3155151 RepID=UPI0033F11345